MKVYIAKTLVEDIDYNSCSVEVFKSLKNAKKFADKEIDSLAEDYGLEVTERADLYFAASSGDTHVTISIEEKELN